MSGTLTIKSINGNKNFQHVKLFVNPSLKSHLLIFIKDGEADFDYDKVKQASDKWSILVVSNLQEAKKMIMENYNYTEGKISTMIFKSHGHAFEGADLDSKQGQGVVHKFSEDKNSPEVFLRKLLGQTSTVMFTACSIIQSFDKIFESPNISKDQNNKNHEKAKETVNNYYNFWIKKTKRNLLIDYTSTSSWNFSNNDGSKDKDGIGTFTGGDKYWFVFDSNFIIPKIKGQYFAGFVWFVDNGTTYSYKPNFYQLQVKSEGGIAIRAIKSINNNNNNKIPSEIEKNEKKL